MGGGFPQFCRNQSHATFTLRQTEPTLHFHTLAFISVILSLVSGLTLPGTPQRRTGEPDSVCLAIAEIFTVPINLVRQNTAGIVSFTLTEPFCHLLQISSFVVTIKRAAFQSGPAIYNADVQFGPKLHWLSGFSPGVEQMAGLR